MSGESERQSPYTTSIHVLDDYSILNIFYLYRPPLIGEEDQGADLRFAGGAQWVVEHWWYRLTHVCRRWRNLILGAATYLNLCLVCTDGTPVADMLAHSPPLPLVIDYQRKDFTAEDEEAVILALAQRDRVRRIRFILPFLELQKIIIAIDGEYSILEYMMLSVPHEDKRAVLILPETLQIPHLRYLLINCSIPIRPPLLGLAAGLVKLHLGFYHPSTYFQLAALVRWLSMMPHLEYLWICSDPDFNMEMQLMLTPPIMAHAMLPNLRTFALRAARAYSEAVLSRITASRLENFQIDYLMPVSFSVPQLLQFIGRTENFRFDHAEFRFSSERAYMQVGPPETNMPVNSFSIIVRCWHLDFQVSLVAQISDALSQIFSVVEHLTLSHRVHTRSSEVHNEVDRTVWRKLLRSFAKVKTLRVRRGLVEDLSRCLRLEDGEHPLELLPELQELTYSGIGNPDGAFTSFIDARQKAWRPVTLIKSNAL